jgi:NAD(P)-dependent dehydrogenase (short-subunit alcohol dehydrogenase family)
MNELRFDGKVAIVTGAGRGLGREYALLLAQRGASVVVNDLGGELEGEGASSGPADDVVGEIEAAGGTALADHGSVTDQAAMEAMVAHTMARFGRIDAVINNAGIRRMASLAESTIDDYRLQMDIAFFGTLHLTKAAWPHLAASSGRVVNTVSSSIFGLPGGYTGYVAAKGAVLALTRTLAIEAAQSGIGVNAVAPAAVTRFMRSGGAAKTSGLFDWAERTLDPALVAPVVAFLAHSDCSLQGEVLAAGGGQVGRWFMGENLGIVDGALSIETVRDRLEEILDEASHQSYRDAMEQAGRMPAHIESQR